MSVEVLRNELADLEAEERFGGRPYPKGMEVFPHVLPGLGFFPGGDGLWRDAGALDRPSPYPFPKGGIMFLGNDFGVRADFRKLTSHEDPETSVTWKYLRLRLYFAQIDGRCGFYTNAHLGLRRVGPPTGKRKLENPNDKKPYHDLCKEYLKIQIRTQHPKLIVALGISPEGPAELLGQVIEPRSQSEGQRKLDLRKRQFTPAVFEGRPLWVLSAWHPSYDARDLSEPRSKDEGKRLADAWREAQQ